MKKNFLIKNDKAKMSGERKDLMHSVMGGNLKLVHHLHQLSHYTDCDKFLKWLSINRITGEALLDWLKIYHQNSILNMVKFIIKHHNKNKEFKPIILGKDWN